MSLMNRRSEYSWSQTTIADLSVVPEKRVYKLDEKVRMNLGFRILGGLRESFTPDVWTVAWEDNDKMVRLMMESSIRKGGPLAGPLATTGKEVRRAKFYWSRDPDLPFRIWTAIIHEDGSAPIIPTGVDDAKSKFLDVTKTFEFPADGLGRGSHRLVGSVSVGWGRRSYLEKGKLSAKVETAELTVE